MEETPIKLKTARKFTSSFMVAMLALLVAIAITVVALIYARNMSYLLKTMSNNNQLLHRQLQQLQGIQTTVLDRQQQLTKNQQLESGNRKPWILAEVNYLARLASYNLSYSHDTVAALVLLQTADQRIARLNDPDLNQVRQQLADNITALQAVDKVDMAGILAKLSALQLQVKQLPLISPPAFVKAKTDVNTATPPVSVWRSALERSLVTLQSLVIIRHHQEPIEPILSGEQLLYLQQNLQLQLQQAQWAVLHGQKAIYHNTLQQAINSIQTYFASASPQTTAFIQNLQQLQKINIQPDLPDMTALLNSLAQAERPAVANKDK